MTTGTNQFRAQCEALGAPLPWDYEPDGAVLDYHGNFVAQVDPDRDRACDQAAMIAELIVKAVNTRGAWHKTREEAAQRSEIRDQGSEKSD